MTDFIPIKKNKNKIQARLSPSPSNFMKQRAINSFAEKQKYSWEVPLEYLTTSLKAGGQ